VLCETGLTLPETKTEYVFYMILVESIVKRICCCLGGDPYYNWLTQSRLDTFADYTSSGSIDSATTQSSLMFTVGRSPSRPRRAMKQPPVGPDFGKDRLGAGGGTLDKVDGGTGELNVKC